MAKSGEIYIYDIGEWDHFLNDVLPEWINNRENKADLIHANTIDRLLVEPLREIINRSHKKVPNSTFVEAGINLVTYLNYDIVYKFRNNQIMVIEQIETLDKLADKFLAIYGSSQALQTSKLKSKIASKPRLKNAPSKQQLIEIKTKWVYENGHEYGWKKRAINIFSISRTKLKEILNN